MLRDITEFIIHDWPETDARLPEYLQLYYSLRDELTYHAGCVVKSSWVIVPEAYRETIVQRLQRAHLGMSKMKTLEQERVYWPKMHSSIESFVLRCKACQEVSPKWNPIEPLQSHPIPGQPWSKLDSDICYFKGEMYLIPIDYYNNFPIIRNMVTSSTMEVFVILHSIFSEYGLHKELVIEQGPHYTATEFKVFCHSRFVKHTLCIAFHLSSDRCTKKAVQEVKKILCVCKADGSDPNLSLLQYRTTPMAPEEKGPAELLRNSYNDLLSNLQVSVNAARDTD